MKANTKQRLVIASTVITIMAAAISAFLLVGKEARLVDVITLFATAFASGAGLSSAIHKKMK